VSRALAATIRALCEAPSLPEPGDAMTLLDPDNTRGVTVLVYVRRAHGHNLWVWYRDAGAILELVALTNEPPGG
jgi:hypothetical protein